jgi:hypothetical protein
MGKNRRATQALHGAEVIDKTAFKMRGLGLSTTRLGKLFHVGITLIKKDD